MKKRVFLFLCVGFIFILLNGCATTNIPMSSENEKAIHTISIGEVTAPEMATFLGKKERGFAQGGGLIGGMIALALEKSDQEDLKKLQDKDHIVISKIVVDQFINQINNNTHFKVVNQDLSDAKLNILIKEYGMNSYSMTSFKALLLVEASLVKNEKIIWRQTGVVSEITAGLPERDWSDIEKNPHLLYELWDDAANRVVKGMVVTL